MNNQRKTLLILLALLVLAFGYGYWQTPRQQKIDKTGATAVTRTVKQTPVGKRGVKPVADEAWPRLRVDLLERKSEVFPGVQRDLFYGARGMTAAVEPEVETEVEPIPVAPPPVMVAPPPPPPTPEQQVTQELARFTFLGFLKQDGERTIFLSSAGEIFLVHKGDRFGRNNEFLVTRLTPTELAIRQEQIKGEIVILLVDQAPLAPSNFGMQRAEVEAQAAPSPPVEAESEQEVIAPPLDPEVVAAEVEQRRRDMEKRQQELQRRRDPRAGNPFSPTARRTTPQPPAEPEEQPENEDTNNENQ